jgi:hypothetical protein
MDAKSQTERAVALLEEEEEQYTKNELKLKLHLKSCNSH